MAARKSPDHKSQQERAPASDGLSTDQDQKASSQRMAFDQGLGAYSPRNSPDVQLDPSEQTRRSEVQGDAHDVSNQDVVLEQLAHRGAYGELPAQKLGPWGYREAGAKVDPESGFRAVLYVPTAEALEGKTAQAKVIRAIHGGTPPPVLAFRGTEEKRGVQDDASKKSVGSYQFASNQGHIKKLMSQAGGKVIVSGHSLGGALAQLAAAQFPSSTKRVVTFQAPAVSKEAVAALREYNANASAEDQVESTHHRASGDLVHLAGEALTDGDVFTYMSKGIGNPTDHGKFPLARLSAARGDMVPGVNEGLGSRGGDRLTSVNKTKAVKEKAGLMPKFTERARKFLGRAIRDSSMEGYVEVWELVEEMIDSGAFSKTYILETVELNLDLTAVQKRKMSDQVEILMG